MDRVQKILLVLAGLALICYAMLPPVRLIIFVPNPEGDKILDTETLEIQERFGGGKAVE